MAIRCILFDMDNTLLKLDVDWKALTREFDIKYFGGKYDHLSPHQFFVAYFNQLVKDIPDWQHQEIMKKRLEAELDGISGAVCFPYRGVIHKLGRKYKMGVVSGNLKKPIKIALEKCGLAKRFGVIISVEDVAASKPSPLPLRAAMHKLGVKPENTVYVGDHPDDIRTGIVAGTKTICVRHSKHFAEVRKSGLKPDAIIKNLFELEDAIKKIEAADVKKKEEQRKAKLLERKKERERLKELKKSQKEKHKAKAHKHKKEGSIFNGVSRFISKIFR